MAIIITACIPIQNAAAEEGDLPIATNTSFETAREITFATSIGEEMSGSDLFRYYKFSLDSASELYISGTVFGYPTIHFHIYDAARTQIYDYSRYGDGGFTMDPVCLTGGDYYIKLENRESITFKVIANSLSESFTETQDSNNNVAANASVIALSTQYKGVLAQNDDTDFYKFQVPSDGKITFNVTNAAVNSIKCIIYDSSVNGLSENTVYRNRKESKEITLATGTYYLAITKEDLDRSVGSYNFSIDFDKTVSSNQIARPTIISVKNTAKRKITVRWGNVNGAGGYQLQYSKNKKFKKGVTQKTISSNKTSVRFSKLTKGKKYYVRIRSFKVENGKKTYSSWSTKKSVKIKK